MQCDVVVTPAVTRVQTSFSSMVHTMLEFSLHHCSHQGVILTFPSGSIGTKVHRNRAGIFLPLFSLWSVWSVVSMVIQWSFQQSVSGHSSSWYVLMLSQKFKWGIFSTVIFAVHGSILGYLPFLGFSLWSVVNQRSSFQLICIRHVTQSPAWTICMVCCDRGQGYKFTSAALWSLEVIPLVSSSLPLWPGFALCVVHTAVPVLTVLLSVVGRVSQHLVRNGSQCCNHTYAGPKVL